MLIILLLVCCCCLLILLLCVCRKRRKPKRRRGGHGGGNLAYTLKDQDNPMRLPTAALAVGVPKSEYSPRTKISMMSRLGSKPMIALQETHHVELSKLGMTPRVRDGRDRRGRGGAEGHKKKSSASRSDPYPETLTSRKLLSAPLQKSESLAAPPPTIPESPMSLPPAASN